MPACQSPQATVPDEDVDSAASFFGYVYIVSQYTVRLMTPCVLRILCLRNSSSVPYFWQPPNLPTAARRSWQCTECGTTAFSGKRIFAKSVHLSTFGAKTETEVEIRSTSTYRIVLATFGSVMTFVYLYRGKCWRRFGWWRIVGWPAAEVEYDAVSNPGQDVVYSCKLVLQVGQKSCWQCCVRTVCVLKVLCLSKTDGVLWICFRCFKKTKSPFSFCFCKTNHLLFLKISSFLKLFVSRGQFS